MASALALVVVFLVSACVAPAERIPPMTDDELTQFAAAQRADYWVNLGVPNDTPPLAVQFIEYVDVEQYGNVQTECVDGMQSEPVRPDIAEVVAGVELERRPQLIMDLQWFICEGMYPLELEDMGLLSAAQLDALYEHYQRFTVPCLVAKGYQVGPPPSLEDFRRAGWPSWSPVDALVIDYDSVSGGLPMDVYVDLYEDCRAQPREFFGEPWWLQR